MQKSQDSLDLVVGAMQKCGFASNDVDDIVSVYNDRLNDDTDYTALSMALCSMVEGQAVCIEVINVLYSELKETVQMACNQMQTNLASLKAIADSGELQGKSFFLLLLKSNKLIS